ncbi:hypothetical protein HU200_056826 [Digitaria exilis]|uniref:chitinase n=1 Tax=Digitaria exilis TaxID=1010633 RepID=A0A835ACB1_9POAL|nr:hypothetical protein HU200_056826 [Digitaria exilis]
MARSSCAAHGALLLLIATVAFFVASGGSGVIGVAEARYYGHGQCSSVSALVSEQLYNSLFLHKDDPACPAKGFYTYSSFIQAARTFPKFAATGDINTRKREIAAFFAQISHETTGGWATAPDGPYSNFNYGPAGRALGFDGLRNPEVVANCSDTAWRTALWFWMTPRRPKPSCHEVMVGEYRPSVADLAANRTPGFGLVTNIVNGGLECNRTDDARVNNRIGFYQRYCQIFNVDTGPNLDCAHQQPY